MMEPGQTETLIFNEGIPHLICTIPYRGIYSENSVLGQGHNDI